MNKYKKTINKGFTLIEFVVVIAIMAILALVALPSVSGYADKAKYEKDLQNAKTTYGHILVEHGGSYTDSDVDYMELKAAVGLKESDVITLEHDDNGNLLNIFVNKASYPNHSEQPKYSESVRDDDESVYIDLFTYFEYDDGTVAITGLNQEFLNKYYNGKSPKEVVMPSYSLDGRKVTTVNATFYNIEGGNSEQKGTGFSNMGIEVLKFPEDVQTIGSSFAMNKIEHLELPDNVTYIDTSFYGNPIKTVTAKLWTSSDGNGNYTDRYENGNLHWRMISILESDFPGFQFISK